MNDAHGIGFDWQRFALCRGADASVFFDAMDEQAKLAKRVCARCPVRVPCLAFALAHRERFGIWGGTTENERRRMPSVERERVLQDAGVSAA